LDIHHRHVAVAPVLALLVNAFVWGVSWWPFRRLQEAGLHPLWATTVVYLLAAVVIAAWRPRSLRQLATTPSLWLIALASGSTNATFNWAVSIGDVVRVVLLFYLMPLWALLLARLILKEHLTRGAFVRLGLALGGAALVLSQGAPPEGGGAGAHAGNEPVLGALTLPDLLALIGGFAFALNNVMLRREAARPEEGRALAMFVGGVVVAGATAVSMSAGSGPSAAAVPWPAGAAQWALPAFGLALAFMASNLCLQYGAARLPATATAVVMPSEVLFAALTAVWWGGAALHWPVLAGGALILGAALASAIESDDAH
jgi:drug/metabolite transporter (DMT)-like permease